MVKPLDLETLTDLLARLPSAPRGAGPERWLAPPGAKSSTG